jgi:hypothetical protein
MARLPIREAGARRRRRERLDRERQRRRRQRNPVNPIQSGEVLLMVLGIAFGVAGTLGYQNYVAPKLNA